MASYVRFCITICFFFFFLSLSSTQKVTLSLYYEALCPFCADFIVNHLPQIFQNGLISTIDLHLIPWGNTLLKPDGTILCQHGEAECALNAIHAVESPYKGFVYTISLLQMKHVGYIYCTERLVLENKLEQWADCFELVGLSRAALGCVQNMLHLNFFYNIGICVKLTISKPSWRDWYKSISDAKAGQFIRLRVISKRSEQSVSNRIEVILKSLIQWYLSINGEILSAIDPRLGSDYDGGEASVALAVGLLCCHQNPECRPSMRGVLRFLNGEEEVAEIDDDWGFSKSPRSDFGSRFVGHVSSSSLIASSSLVARISSTSHATSG